MCVQIFQVYKVTMVAVGWTAKGDYTFEMQMWKE